VCDEAREHWKPIADMLYGMGVMADAFAPALGLLVNALGRYIDLERQLDEHGYVSTTDKGNRIAEPIWSARNKAWEQVLKALREFGMTPASLSAVTRGQADKEDGDDDDVRGSILQKIG
jgi:P27 family predicted phage terminase small subunit